MVCLVNVGRRGQVSVHQLLGLGGGGGGGGAHAGGCNITRQQGNAEQRKESVI
jgi:hypothetical protein